VPAGTVQALAAGNSGTCVVVDGAAHCAGSYSGNGSTSAVTTPVTPTGLGSNVTGLLKGASYYNSMGAIQSGQAVWWGENNFGQLGNQPAATTPQAIPLW
jgi:hypothetical protein